MPYRQETEATMISVTHHRGLTRYHAQVLELVGEGEWKLSEASDIESES